MSITKIADPWEEFYKKLKIFGVGVGILILVFLLLYTGFIIGKGLSEGGRKEKCYPNKTCDAGLTCLDNICIKKD